MQRKIFWKKFCFQKKLLTFAARFGRNDKFIDLLERENEVKKLKAKDSLLIEKSFSDQLRDYNFKEGMQE